MALITSRDNQREAPGVAYTNIIARGIRLANDIDVTKTRSASNTLTLVAMGELQNSMIDYKNFIISYRGLSGLASAAKRQKNDSNYDLATDLTAIISAINTATKWLVDNIQKTANGVEIINFNASRQMIYLPQQDAIKAGYIAQLDAVLLALGG